VLLHKGLKKVFSLDDYRSKKSEILASEKLSQKGKDEALLKLEREKKDEARKAVKSLRQSAVENALKLRDAQEKRFEKIKEAQASIDYARLNYEAQAMASRIKASESLSDVLEVWDSVKRSNDAYAIKAFKDTSQGLIAEKFGDDYTNLRGSLFEDMSKSLVELAQVEMSKDELEARDALRKIESEAQEINKAFGSGDAVINRVLDGVSFENGKVELGFDYEINKLSDKSEMLFEVFNRLENNREKVLTEYQNTLKEKGFDGEIDGDFDDFRDVFYDD